MKLLRFISSAKFSWKGVSLVVSVSGISLDAAVGMSANLGERLWKGGMLSQSDWLTADRSKSSSGNRLRSNPETSGRSDQLWQTSIDATGRKRGDDYDAKGWKADSGCKDLEILKAWTLGESLGDKTTLVMVKGAISAIFLGKYPSGTNNWSVLGSRHQNPCTIGLVRLQFGQSIHSKANL